jgi:hypothetical protein
MPIDISHVSYSKNTAQQRPGKMRSYPGELIARRLIKWLNELDDSSRQIRAKLPPNKSVLIVISPPARERRERIEAIIRLWQSLATDVVELFDLKGSVRSARRPWKWDAEQKIHDKLSRKMNRLNTLLKRYSGRRKLVGIDETSKSLVRVVSRRSLHKTTTDWDNRDEQGEWDAVETVTELAAQGRIGKLQRCAHCKRWLFKRFTHHTCCSGGKCRERKYRSSEKWKKHRREWQRENYRVNKVIDQGREETGRKK